MGFSEIELLQIYKNFI